jgi:hypothetical protein
MARDGRDRTLRDLTLMLDARQLSPVEIARSACWAKRRLDAMLELARLRTLMGAAEEAVRGRA